MSCLIMDSPLGALLLTATDRGLTSVRIAPSQLPKPEPAVELPVLSAASRQIEAYFAGDRQGFDLPLDWSGVSPFACKVLRALQQVPYAATVSYAELAARTGSPRAARAVGRVMASNPWPLVVPCHRVLASNGSLCGYSGGRGLPTKQWLLEFEQHGAGG